MRFVYLVLLLLCLSCRSGTVVYHKVDGKWRVKEIHVEMKNITPANIARETESLNHSWLEQKEEVKEKEDLWNIFLDSTDELSEDIKEQFSPLDFLKDLGR